MDAVLNLGDCLSRLDEWAAVLKTALAGMTKVDKTPEGLSSSLMREVTGRLLALDECLINVDTLLELSSSGISPSRLLQSREAPWTMEYWPTVCTDVGYYAAQTRVSRIEGAEAWC
jgi:hypothetical protein